MRDAFELIPKAVQQSSIMLSEMAQNICAYPEQCKLERVSMLLTGQATRPYKRAGKHYILVLIYNVRIEKLTIKL